ncbi:hypothetical protein [Streptomyces goshikiensis]|uniref:hypothetical protein n=1 Tax=Streptomyces goshikiensis TaxID=1942 RepID=UPI003663616A
MVDTTSTIYTSGGPYQRAKTTFSTGSGAPRRLHYLLARDSGGQMFRYWGDGEDSLAGDRGLIGGGWNTYNQMTKLTPVTEHLNYPSGTPVSVTAGTGEIVGRDAAGVLWHYRRQFSNQSSYADRTRIGGGWNIYNQLIGSADVTGDGRPDLLARDGAGVLWLYKGNDNPHRPLRRPRPRRGRLEHLQPIQSRRRHHRRQPPRPRHPRQRRRAVALQGQPQPKRPLRRPHPYRYRLEHLQPTPLKASCCGRHRRYLLVSATAANAVSGHDAPLSSRGVSVRVNQQSSTANDGCADLQRSPMRSQTGGEAFLGLCEAGL